MAASDLYTICPPLIQSLFDKDSALLLANATIEFYVDTDRLTPKPVFEIGGTSPAYTYSALPNPVILNGSGQPINASNAPTTIYLYPFDANGNIENYYVVIKSATSTTQITLENWPNLDAGATAKTENLTSVDNQISNPQFAEVYINEGIDTVYASTTVEQTFAFAPDWDIVTKGTGTVTVSRTAVAGNTDTPTSPPYYISIATSSGIEYCRLRQRMRTNSGLWSTNDGEEIYIAAGILAQAVIAESIELKLITSFGGTPINLLTKGAAPAFSYLRATSDVMPSSSDTNTGDDGYIDIYLQLNASQTMDVTSIQIVPVYTLDGGDALDFKFNSTNRQEAYLNDYYAPALSNRYQGNILTGWDFALNPAQFGVSGTVPVFASAAYIWDQTIAGRSTDSVAYSRSSAHDGMLLTTSGAAGSFYVMQYLRGAEVRKILGTVLSINAQTYHGTSEGNVTLRAYVYRAPNASSVPTLPASIVDVASGVATLTASAVSDGWTEVGRQGMGTATAALRTFTSSTEVPTLEDHKFSGWLVSESSEIDDTTKLAVVITYQYEATATTIRLLSVNLCPGPIPSRPIPETFDSVLRQCQYYYEKSYNYDVVLDAVTTVGQFTAPAFPTNGTTDTARCFAAYFNLPFKNVKRTIPDMAYYNPASNAVVGASKEVFARCERVLTTTFTSATANVSVALWTKTIGTQSVLFARAGNTALTAGLGTGSGGVDAWINFHYTADARLGIV